MAAVPGHGSAPRRAILRRRRAVVSTALAVALGGVAAAPASANNFSFASGRTGCQGVNMADNRDHFFYYVNIELPTRYAVDWSRANNYNPTVLNTYNEANGLNSSTDVTVEDFDYEGAQCNGTYTWISQIDGGGLVGFVQCWTLTSANKCDQQRAYFDTDYMGPRSDAAERALACHELGHTVGLMHRTMNTSCLLEGFHTITTLDQHDRDHFNSI